MSEEVKPLVGPPNQEITLKEAAKEFQVSYYLLHYHVAKGNLKSRRSGRTHLVRRALVADLLQTTKSRGVPRQVVVNQ